MKNNKNKIIIIVIDIIALILMVFTYMLTHRNADSGYKYKAFRYDIPSDITFYIEDESMELDHANWHASIIVFKDLTNYLLTNKDQTNKQLSYKFDVAIMDNRVIDAVDVLLFECKEKSTGDNKIITYLRYPTDSFMYEVTLYNKDNSYNAEPLETIIPILMKGKYNRKNDNNEYFYINQTSE